MLNRCTVPSYALHYNTSIAKLSELEGGGVTYPYIPTYICSPRTNERYPAKQLYFTIDIEPPSSCSLNYQHLPT